MDRNATDHINADFSFSPDNRRILFAMRTPDNDGPSLFTCSRDDPGVAELLEGLPADIGIFDCAWSSNDLIAFAGEIRSTACLPRGTQPCIATCTQGWSRRNQRSSMACG